jgi:hypothetical protein
MNVATTWNQGKNNDLDLVARLLSCFEIPSTHSVFQVGVIDYNVYAIAQCLLEGVEAACMGSVESLSVPVVDAIGFCEVVVGTDDPCRCVCPNGLNSRGRQHGVVSNGIEAVDVRALTTTWSTNKNRTKAHTATSSLDLTRPDEEVFALNLPVSSHVQIAHGGFFWEQLSKDLFVR